MKHPAQLKVFVNESPVLCLAVPKGLQTLEVWRGAGGGTMSEKGVSWERER